MKPSAIIKNLSNGPHPDGLKVQTNIGVSPMRAGDIEAVKMFLDALFEANPDLKMPKL